MRYLAHSPTDLRPEGHLLAEHLASVSGMAASFFSDPFMRRVAAIIGLYHDAGKYKLAFQRYLDDRGHGRVDHSTMGGKLVSLRFPPALAPLMAMPVLGHHGGMPNAVAAGAGGRSMDARLADALDEQAADAFDGEMDGRSMPPTLPPPTLKAGAGGGAFEVFMAVHMLYSALVDADYLDTEAYFDPGQARLRGQRPNLAQLNERYRLFMERLGGGRSTPIDGIRAAINARALAAADGDQGVYTLTVPTGGGKTLASLGFALRHAQKHKNIRRIVYAIPFTSIIEQNAAVFRMALGDEAVLEHHSAYGADEQGTAADRASENWDAPVVVTTNVQLFESLFSNKPSSCRKLHNLADSVIILDEMQALPDAQLRPCLAALHSLVLNHRATVVISTATQPYYLGVWPEVAGATEIMDDPRALYQALRRTRIENLGTLSGDALLRRLADHDQALVIVNTRAHAQALYRALGGEAMGAYHLSTMMCAAHRSLKLQAIRERLEAGHTCRLISTSLIEAGVDIDFPVVYRAAAGLDSIVQAAGRCNRHGGMAGLAPVYVFTPSDHPSPPETGRLSHIALDEVAPHHPDLLGQDAITAFFRLRFGPGAILDEKEIVKRIAQNPGGKFPYADIAHDFAMIQSAGQALVIPYDDGARGLIAQLEGAIPPGVARRLQKYTVTVYDRQLDALKRRGFVRQYGSIAVLDVSPEQWALTYRQDLGLDIDANMAFSCI